MQLTRTAIPEVLLIEPRLFGDSRGFFLESYNGERYAEQGLDAVFVQDNLSRSSRGVLRGLHYQHPNGQGKLVQVIEGTVFDVAVDIRRGSPTFGQHVAVTLEAPVRQQLYVPPGFAHGFCVLSETAVFFYKCTAYYDPHGEYGIRWDDPALGIDWPIREPLLSEKDAAAPLLGDAPEAHLPNYDPA